jgi:hypothetical protein
MLGCDGCARIFSASATAQWSHGDNSASIPTAPGTNSGSCGKKNAIAPRIASRTIGSTAAVGFGNSAKGVGFATFFTEL